MIIGYKRGRVKEKNMVSAVEAAEKYGLSSMKMEDITTEVQAVRRYTHCE